MHSVTEFARALVRSGDLDPIYTMLNRARLDEGSVARWCLGYWMFYHAGVASRLAEQQGDAMFWGLALDYLDNQPRVPRGSERRHFRGAAGLRAVHHLRDMHGTPVRAVNFVATGAENCLSGAARQRFEAIRNRALTWTGFGPWIAFKIADMVDAVLAVPVDFQGAMPYLFEDPIRGGVYVHGQLLGHDDPENVEGLKCLYENLRPAERLDAAADAVAHLQSNLADLRCPHADRPLELPEFETILCKYKAHLHGKYPLGKDTTEIRHALDGWGDLAQHLRTCLP